MNLNINRNRHTDIETTHVYERGKDGGGKLEVWD